MDFKNISPELQSKARKCNTPEEILNLAKEEGYALSEEELQALSGGAEWRCTDQACGEYYPCPADMPI